MSTAAAPMDDEAIHAFSPVPPPRRPEPTRRRLWPWLLGAALLLTLLVAFAGGALLLNLADGAREGVNIHIDGDDWDPAFIVTDHWFGALMALVAVLFTLCLVLPLVLLLALLGAALAIGLALLVATLVVALALSPLLLPILLLVWLLRRPSQPMAQPAR